MRARNPQSTDGPVRLPPLPPPDKAHPTTFSERSMFGPATIAIAIFVLVIAVLNRVEFGRFD